MKFSDRDSFEIGKRHFEGKNYGKAETILRAIIKGNKGYADVFHMLGVICHNAGRFTEAIQCFNKARKINPNYVEATLNLAVLYNDLGQYSKAKALYAYLQDNGQEKKRVDVVMKGKLSNMHAMMGDTYRGIGFDAEAIEEYQKALGINPHYADIRTKLGIALREKGQYKDAIGEFKQALKDKSHYLEAQLQLGLTEYARGEKAAAKREWQAVLRKFPQNLQAQAYLRLLK